MKKFDKSQKLFAEAQKYLPGGVNSPVRAFKAVGGTPPFIARGKGSKIYDADSNEFIDFVNSWGPMILGHAYPPVVAALKKAAGQGTSYGAPTELETVLAKMISTAMPSIEMLRLVSSGTEATMSALRLARAFTGRDKIIKFDGGYHGHADGLLTKAGSGVATLGIPDSPGVPASYAQCTLVAPYNNLEAVEQLFKSYPEQIATVIVEPVAANMGVVSPQPGFLAGLRKLTAKYGTLLIFDEVITGFRLSYGGAQAMFKITPDLTCLGKIIGGGLPVGAYGGRRDIMSLMAPLGPVYQAGTLSGNPLAMTAGIETLKALNQPGVYAQLEKKSAALEKGIVKAAAAAGVGLYVSRVASLLTAFFTPDEVFDYESAKKADTRFFGNFFWQVINEGVYWPPSQFEAAFISLAHSDEDIDFTVAAIARALKSL
ncbi:MAG: glutamate-1-semialdehyde 2,1-aminomutase [Dehalococcoidales bacterium]|nr:glutamate-1-semialdehyde 2,1-aminomutase [Dehalococcoidales bacterium]